MIHKKLAVIGVGNMGWAIVQRILDANLISKEHLILLDPTLKERMGDRLDLNIAEDIQSAVKDADIILLAVKPQYLTDVLKDMQPHVKKDALFISIAAGYALSSIKEHVGKDTAIVRVMPNLAATVGESMSGWIKSPEVSQEQTSIVTQILQAIGKEIEVQDEQAIDAITAITGSGPAYAFYLTQLLEEAAADLGFRNDVAKTLALQTMIGSIKLLQESTFDAKTLKEHVTSKGGTTEAAFKEFERNGLDTSFKKGVKAAFQRAQELGK